MKRNRKRKIEVRAKCVVCGDLLIGQRHGARYCSGACRQAAYRARVAYVNGEHRPTSSQWARAAAQAQALLNEAARLMGR
jgi:hypothetical protein